MTSVIYFSIEDHRCKIKGSEDIGRMVLAICQREGINPNHTLFKVLRTGQIISLFDCGKRADSFLQPGDRLTIS